MIVGTYLVGDIVNDITSEFLHLTKPATGLTPYCSPQ